MNKQCILGMSAAVIMLCFGMSTASEARICFLPDAEECSGGTPVIPPATGCQGADECYENEPDCESAIKDSECERVCVEGYDGLWYPECKYRDEYDCLADADTENGETCALDACGCPYIVGQDPDEQCKEAGFTETSDKLAGESCGSCERCVVNGTEYDYWQCTEDCAGSGYTLTADDKSSMESQGYICTACPCNSEKYKCEQNCDNYPESTKKDAHCWNCSETCPVDSSKFKCTENVQTGYKISGDSCVCADGYVAKNGECVIPEGCKDGYTTTACTSVQKQDDKYTADGGDVCYKCLNCTETTTKSGSGSGSCGATYILNEAQKNAKAADGYDCTSCTVTTTTKYKGNNCNAEEESTSETLWSCSAPSDPTKQPCSKQNSNWKTSCSENEDAAKVGTGSDGTCYICSAKTCTESTTYSCGSASAYSGYTLSSATSCTNGYDTCTKTVQCQNNVYGAADVATTKYKCTTNPGTECPFNLVSWDECSKKGGSCVSVINKDTGKSYTHVSSSGKTFPCYLKIDSRPVLYVTELNNYDPNLMESTNWSFGYETNRNLVVYVYPVFGYDGSLEYKLHARAEELGINVSDSKFPRTHYTCPKGADTDSTSVNNIKDFYCLPDGEGHGSCRNFYKCDDEVATLTFNEKTKPSNVIVNIQYLVLHKADNTKPVRRLAYLDSGFDTGSGKLFEQNTVTYDSSVLDGYTSWPTSSEASVEHVTKEYDNVVLNVTRYFNTNRTDQKEYDSSIRSCASDEVKIGGEDSDYSVCKKTCDSQDGTYTPYEIRGDYDSGDESYSSDIVNSCYAEGGQIKRDDDTGCYYCTSAKICKVTIADINTYNYSYRCNTNDICADLMENYPARFTTKEESRDGLTIEKVNKDEEEKYGNKDFFRIYAGKFSSEEVDLKDGEEVGEEARNSRIRTTDADTSGTIYGIFKCYYNGD